MTHSYKLFAAAALAMFIAACAGNLVRDEVAEPALASVWTRVRVDIAAELENEPSAEGSLALAQADAAITTGDNMRMAGVPWPKLMLIARAGIQREASGGGLHPAVAESLIERVSQFQQTIDAYLKRSKP